MKITVIADDKGNILGTYRQPAQVPKGYPTFKIHGGPGHKVHELDLPAEFEKIPSADELHRRLSDHLKNPASRSR
jgi:hypothetical protein